MCSCGHDLPRKKSTYPGAAMLWGSPSYMLRPLTGKRWEVLTELKFQKCWRSIQMIPTPYVFITPKHLPGRWSPRQQERETSHRLLCPIWILDIQNMDQSNMVAVLCHWIFEWFVKQQEMTRIEFRMNQTWNLVSFWHASLPVDNVSWNKTGWKEPESHPVFMKNIQVALWLTRTQTMWFWLDALRLYGSILRISLSGGYFALSVEESFLF